MKERGGKGVKKRLLSLFLSLCMVLSLMPATMVEAASTTYHVGGVTLDMSGTTIVSGGAWTWDGPSKTLTFIKNYVNPGTDQNKYTVEAAGLPAGTTIVLNDGVRAQLTSAYGDALYCEGDLTIIGNGSLTLYGSNSTTFTGDTGYANDDTNAGSGMVCQGKLTIGDATTMPYVYIHSMQYANHALEIYADSTGEGSPIMEIVSGFVDINTSGVGQAVIYTTGSDKYVNVENDAVLLYPSMNDDYVRLSYAKLVGNGYYYGADASYGEIIYDCNGAQGGQGVPTKGTIRYKLGNYADLTVTATPAANNGKIFWGWNTTSGATSVLSSLQIDQSMVDSLENSGQGLRLYAIYRASEFTPNASVDYAKSQLTGLIPGEKYKITLGGVTTEVTSADDGTYTISNMSDYYGQDIKIAKSGTNNAADSEAQTITLLSRGSAPFEDDFTVTQASGGSTEGTITKKNETGLTSGYEYSLNGGTTWITGGSTPVSADVSTADQQVLIRVPATTNAPASEYITITLEKAKTPYGTPATSVNYLNSELTDLVAGGSYGITVNGTAYGVAIADSEGKIIKSVLDISQYYGSEITLVRRGDANYGDSAPQTINVLTQAAAPAENLFTVDQAEGAETTASVSGITSTYEYSTDDGVNWTPGTGTDVVVDAGQSVYVRIPATVSAPPSLACEITTNPAQNQETRPSATADYEASQLVDLVAGASYKITINGSENTYVADGDGKIAKTDIDLKDCYGKTISIVKAGNGTTTYDSAAQTLTIKSPATAADTANFTLTQAVRGETEATLIKTGESGLTSVYEYSVNGGSTWIAGSDTEASKIDVANSAVEVWVRKAATVTDPASDKTVLQANKAQTQEPQPTGSVDYKASQLVGLTAGEDYKITINGTIFNCTADGSGKIATDIIDISNYYGKEITIVKLGDNVDTYDSDEQTWTIEEPAAAPAATEFSLTQAVNGATEATLVKAGEDGLTTAYEYSIDNGVSWTSGYDTVASKINVADEEKIVLVRVPATTTTPASKAAELLAKKAQTKEVIVNPENVKPNYITSKLTGLQAGEEYVITVDGNVIAQGTSGIADTDGNIAIPDISSYTPIFDSL